MTSAPISTINDLFFRIADAANPRAVLCQDHAGQWQQLSSGQIYQRVRAVGSRLLEWGVKKGDRVALISENRWEWAVTDFAILAIGAADVPVYPTLTGEQISVLLTDADCRIAFVSTRAQLDKLNTVRNQTPLERIVMMDADAPKGAIPYSSLIEGADSLGSQRDPVFDALAHSAEPKDLATLIYTSGTTGEPKGVMLTHGNIAANQCYCIGGYEISPSDTCISFLPLSHITARALDYAMYNAGAQVAYCAQFDKLPQAMKEIRPTFFVGVPRVYEKIRQAVEHKSAASPIRKRLLALALKMGLAHSDEVYRSHKPSAFGWKLANKLVYSKVQEAFGGRVRYFVSGGAPLGVDTARWFASAGIAVWEGYGLTETSPVIALNNPNAQRLGSVGPLQPNIEIQFASDGELLIRGPIVFQGYWKKPQANAECFSGEGWFHTGDIGHQDADGFLYITDRKKELLKTSGGKLVAPQPIENKLKTNVLVGNAALIGDKHKFISVLISPNFTALEGWARQQGVAFSSRAELVVDSRVHKLYHGIVHDINADLASFESLKRFRLVPEEWTQETGELTPSMKLKRRVITERYASLVAEIYADEATSRGE
ncbi:AMP-dependent synthetase/ligase [Terracidiphilus sp.]|jgi:long-chain acyl-CoA synthetase|uniref:AMP-dependent synthetase/ligase n=1 Tax=Terracidiphilus sp. TaxID=1964191 RepID=UPI003C230612